MLDGIKPSREATKSCILLVDDEPQILKAYRRVLVSAGFEVVAVSRGDEVAQLLATVDFDAVISDIGLPGMNGIGVLRAVRASDPDLPVVLMTAGADLTSAMEAVEHGALRYLIKPVPPSLLSDTALEATRWRQVARIKRRAFEL